MGRVDRLQPGLPGTPEHCGPWSSASGTKQKHLLEEPLSPLLDSCQRRPPC